MKMQLNEAENNTTGGKLKDQTKTRDNTPIIKANNQSSNLEISKNSSIKGAEFNVQEK